jgi:hypothetical protein
LVILVSASSHHEITWTGSWDGRINWGSRCSQDRMRLHTALANGQSSDKCSPVSSGPLHKAQWSWWGHPLLQVICCKDFFSHQNLDEHFALVLCMSFPYEVTPEAPIGTSELDPISWSGRVRAISCPSPDDGVSYTLCEVDVLDSDPQGDKFLNLDSGGDPTI